MAEAGGPGKRLGLLPLIRRHEDDVEADLQRFYNIDYRDRYLPGGGPSRLTVRRLLTLVAKLPVESLFHSACADRLPMSMEAAAVMDLWSVWTRKPHPARGKASKFKADAAEKAERPQIIARRRAGARAHNERFLAARRRRMQQKGVA